MSHIRLTLLGTALAAMVISAGCGSSEDAEIATQRDRLWLSEEPADATTIEEAKEAVAENSKVTIVGRLNLEMLDSRGNDKAMCMVTEIISDGHEDQAGHDVNDCPFCKRKAANAPKAAVAFVDEEGKVLPYGVDKLFPIEQGDIVVIQGKAELDEKLDVFKVTASGIHARQK